MDQVYQALISLAAAAVNGTTPDRELVSGADLTELFRAASFHQMTALAACELGALGIEDENFVRDRRRQEAKDAFMDYEREQILHALEEAGIWYLPLKGVILRDYYPNPALRQMADTDILFDVSRSADVQRIMESFGFVKDPEDEIEHQEVYRKPPASVFEMHTMLFDTLTDKRLYEYYKNVEERLLGDGFQRRMSHEDFYLYMIAHEYKHFYWGGIGLRALMDTYVFLKRFGEELDWKYIRSEAYRLGILEFETRNRTLARKVFSAGTTAGLEDEEKTMLDYFVASGAFGTQEFVIHNKMREVGKFRYWLERTFLPMETIKYHYPLFYKHRILLPVLPVYRFIRGWKNAKNEFKTAGSTDKSIVNRMKGLRNPDQTEHES